MPVTRTGKRRRATAREEDEEQHEEQHEEQPFPLEQPPLSEDEDEIRPASANPRPSRRRRNSTASSGDAGEIRPANTNSRPSSRRRNKPAPSEDEDEILPVSANPRPSRRRRSNASADVSNPVGANGTSEEPTDAAADGHDEDEDFVEDALGGRAHPTHDDDEANRNEYDHDGVDGSDGADEDDDGDDVEEAAAFLSANSAFATSGILHSVKLDNFMSHSCFQYDLGPNVNIVQGANGSGKSAIVAALQVGLGARPSQTERGSRLDELIKHGQKNAQITIKIWNKKPQHRAADMTYKNDVFGDMITIERRIMKNAKGATSSWNVKGKGKTFKPLNGQTHRKEVMDIVDHFGFMVDNPVVILTQTKSKAFLAKGKPSQHYKMYREATLLDPLKAELIETIRVNNEVKRLIKNADDKRPKTEKVLEKLSIAHEEAQKMKTIDTDINSAVLRLAWTNAQEQEMKLSKYQRRMADEFQPRADKAYHDYKKHNEKLDVVQKEREDMSAELEECVGKVRQTTTRYRNAVTQDSRLEQNIKSCRGRIRELEMEISDAKHRVEQQRTRMDQARTDHFKGQEQKARLVEELGKLTEEEKAKSGELRDNREKEASFTELRDDIQRKINHTLQHEQSLEAQFNTKMREFDHWKRTADSSNHIGRFGQTMPDLVRRIQSNAQQFSVPPIGPLGQYLKVRDESWAPAVEEAVGRGFLCSFIVQTSRDAQTLQRMLPQRGPRIQVLVFNMNVDRYHVGQRDMPDVHDLGHCTIIEMLEVSNHIVYNALIDYKEVERTVLNGKDADITELGWSGLPNLKVVWNKKGDRAYDSGGSKTFRNGRPNISAQILTTDLSAYLDSLGEEIKAIEVDKGQVSRARSEAEKEKRELGMEENDIRMRSREISHRLQGIHGERARIEDQLSQAENAFDPTPFEREIMEAEASVLEVGRKVKDEEERMKRHEVERQNYQDELRAAKEENHEAKQENKRLTLQLEEKSEAIAQVKSKVRKLKLVHDKEQENMTLANAALDEQRGKVLEARESAQGQGECPEGLDCRTASSRDVEREVERLRKRRETEQNRRGGKTAVQIETEYLEAKKTYDHNTKRYNRVVNYLRSLGQGIKRREENLVMLEKTLKKIVRSNFRKFLGARGHDGGIRFTTDGESRELVISTKMANHETDNGERHETKDLRSLSGGERSFTTLCFMLALAEICQNPVRVMDEIDVFQDEANRRASFKVLIEFFVKFLTDKQIVIITPHSLPPFDQSPSIKISKFDPPREENGPGVQTRIDDFVNN